MIIAYLYYPTGIATVHKNISCKSIGMRKKKVQRTMTIDVNSISSVLNSFKNKLYNLSSNKNENDMLIKIDFGNAEFEEAVINYILSILQTTRRPFKKTKLHIHC